MRARCWSLRCTPTAGTITASPARVPRIASAVSTGRVAIVGMCYSLQHGRAKLTFGHGSWLDVPEHGGVEHQG